MPTSNSALGQRLGRSQASRGRGPCLRQPRGTSAQPPALMAGGGLGGGGVSATWTPPNSPAHVSLTVLSSRRPEAAVSAVPSPAPARSPWRLLPEASRVRRVAPPSPRPSQPRPMGTPVGPSSPRPSCSVGQWRRLVPPAASRAHREGSALGGAPGAAGQVRGVTPAGYAHHLQGAPRLAEEAAPGIIGWEGPNT